MNPRRPSRHLALCTASLFLIGVSALRGQLADIPIKPGLWNTQVVAKIGLNDNDNEPIVSQACFTAGTTISGYLAAMTKSAPDVQCTMSNKVQTANHIAFDTTCTSPNATSKSHSDFQIADSEHFSGTSHSTVVGSSRDHPINMEMNKTFTAKFLSSNCGDVKPLTDQSIPQK
jgi:hypothetical protein